MNKKHDYYHYNEALSRSDEVVDITIKRASKMLEECDTVQIVRCRDCEYIDSWEFAEGKIRYVCVHFDYTDIAPNGFCAWGERR